MQILQFLKHMQNGSGSKSVKSTIVLLVPRGAEDDVQGFIQAPKGNVFGCMASLASST